MLAQLLDSTRYSACGVELNLFSNSKIFNFEQFKKNIHKSSKACGIHRIRNRINFHRLHSYGLNENELNNMILAAKDLREFRDNFAARFLALRGKAEGGIVYEKTPENINCIFEFTETFRDSYFIHIVRNPLYIYPSMLKRKFPRYISLLSWFIDVAKYIKYKDHERVLLIRYEELVKNPYKIAKDILRTTANITDVSEEEIKTGYMDNPYYKLISPKLKSWNISTFAPVQDANVARFTDAHLRDMAGLLHLQIAPAYARQFDIAQISFMDAIKELGYHQSVMEQLKKFDSAARLPGKSAGDYVRLILKWEEDLRHGDADLFKLRDYLNPVRSIPDR